MVQTTGNEQFWCGEQNGGMKILFAGNKERGVTCLRALVNNGNEIVGVIAHPPVDGAVSAGSVAEEALQSKFPLFQPDNINDANVIDCLRELSPDLIILAGYGQIVNQEIIDLAAKGCINLHAGKLPQYRGSSPMNWALINGETDFTLSIICVDTGVDSGDILTERTFPISENDTIADLNNIANEAFPQMLIELIGKVETGTIRARKQDDSRASYYPLRFPNDGVILWDLFTANRVHNHIRALTHPYPGAFTYFDGQRVQLLSSVLERRRYYGEPGRIYRKTKNGLLVCASDRCLWIRKAIVEESQSDICDFVRRYDKFATLRGLLMSNLTMDKGK